MRFHAIIGIIFHLHTSVNGNFIQTQTDMSYILTLAHWSIMEWQSRKNLR